MSMAWTMTKTVKTIHIATICLYDAANVNWWIIAGIKGAKSQWDALNAKKNSMSKLSSMYDNEFIFLVSWYESK